MSRSDGVFDSHLHLWSLASAFHRWPGPDLAAIHRDFGAVELDALSPPPGAAVVVQAQPDPRETEWLLGVADSHPLIAGVVGWTDLEAAEAAGAVARVAAHPRLLGLRPMLQDMGDARWILRPALDAAIGAMVAHGLRFDALVRPRHLGAIGELARRWPDLRIVIDHGGKPPICEGAIAPWRDDIAALAGLPNVWCKLSGLLTEQPADAPADAMLPHAAHLLRCFGERTMWGSDWPVLLTSGHGYADWLAMCERLVERVAPHLAESVFTTAGRRFYGV